MDLKEFIRNLHLPQKQYCVVGGAMMAEYGIRPIGTHDIDLLTLPSLYKQLLESFDWPWQYRGSNVRNTVRHVTRLGNPTYKYGLLYADQSNVLCMNDDGPTQNQFIKQFKPINLPVEALSTTSFKPTVPKIKRYLSRATIRDGVPFIRPADMLEWKVTDCFDRPQDKVDIELLQKFLGLEVNIPGQINISNINAPVVLQPISLGLNTTYNMTTTTTNTYNTMENIVGALNQALGRFPA